MANGFVNAHWRDLVGGFLVLLGCSVIILNVWKLQSNVQVYAVGVGLMNTGFLAMSIERPSGPQPGA